MKLAAVAVDNAAYSFDREYTYMVPEELEGRALPGCRVTVPFGKGSKKRLGVILSVNEGVKQKGFKYLSEVLDESPLLSEEMLELVYFLKDRTFCTLFEAARAMLPAGINHHIQLSYTAAENSEEAGANLTGILKEAYDYLAAGRGYVKRETLVKNLGLSSDTTVPEELVKKGLAYCNTDAVRNVGDASVRMIALNDEMPAGVRLTAKQKLVYDTLGDVGCATVKELCYFTGVTPAVPGALVRNGVARWVEFEVLRNPCADVGEGTADEINLTPDQQKAYNEIGALMRKGAGVSLLFGITGSGKTSVYLKAIDDAFASGKSVIVMVPEISLTPQTLALFHRRYGKEVAVFHSALSAGERVDEWKRAASGDARIVVGTRSAVFAPLKNIGLIIIDEEQEHTYKSEQSPRYSALDVAKFRAMKHSCLLLLSSATPSVESYANALGGRYSLQKLTERYGSATLPDVITVDMLREPLAQGCSAISQVLLDALKENLENGMQSILLINRRGYNTFAVCDACGSVVTCDSCSISMTYHAANNRLMCHYCGRSVPFTAVCPECGEAGVRYAGFGTQKIEDDLSKLLPGARILRMDTDTTSGKDSHEKMLREFADGEYDIMIGTQMVAKGLDFPSVTLVGVVSVDQQLYNDDFRSLEKTFSLLTQVVGRSGRGKNKGRAIIQTMTPENEIIRLAAEQDYEKFFETEIKIRRALTYPPYCDLCVVGFTGESEIRVRAAANTFLSMLREATSSEYKNEKIIVLGPGEARVAKISNRYRYRMIIKCLPTRSFRKMISQILIAFGEKSEFSAVTVFADMNPETIM